MFVCPSDFCNLLRHNFTLPIKNVLMKTNFVYRSAVNMVYEEHDIAAPVVLAG